LTLVRRLAFRILNATVRGARPELEEWGLAMSREIDFIENDWAALLWAIGSVKSVITSRKGAEMMRAPQINRISGKILIVLSLIALFTVLSGYFQAPHPDEGAGAHIFQLSVVVLAPTILLFLTTADRAKPSRNARLLAFTGVTMALAFGALYYLEHYFYTEHLR
jgi:hypothetical protein